jgi:hypothetical protein
MTALILLIVLLTTLWMGVDATKRDWSGNKFADTTWKWVVGGLGLWIVAFPVYLVHRDRAPLKTDFATGSAFPPAPAPAPDGWIAPGSAGSVPPPSASVPPPTARR